MKRKRGVNFSILCIIFSLGIILTALLYLNERDIYQENEDGFRFTYETIIAEINSDEYTLLIADTNEKRLQGLSDRRGIKEDGMLFIFREIDKHGIWMKDMHMSLDIYWLDKDKKIIHAEYAVSPKTFPFVFTPEEPAKYVIEMPKIKGNLEVGDQVVFK